jgi:hypothetical protein
MKSHLKVSKGFSLLGKRLLLAVDVRIGFAVFIQWERVLQNERAHGFSELGGNSTAWFEYKMKPVF